MPPKRHKRGFTLLEVVVSIALLAALALMITRVFAGSATAMRRGHQDLALDETARHMLDNIATDVHQALIRTNIPFRVSTVSVGDALYCVSPAVHRVEETNPRDCAPIRVRSSRRMKLVQALNRRAVFEYAAGATGSDPAALLDLMRQSNFRRAERVPTNGQMEFTEPLEELDGVADHPFLTFMDFRINGDPASNRSTSEPPNADDPPRFVDVVIGLVSASDARRAMRLHESQGAPAALDYLALRERVYPRRIHMPNTGFTWLRIE